jgi:hypothetical protein
LKNLLINAKTTHFVHIFIVFFLNFVVLCMWLSDSEMGILHYIYIIITYLQNPYVSLHSEAYAIYFGKCCFKWKVIRPIFFTDQLSMPKQRQPTWLPEQDDNSKALERNEPWGARSCRKKPKVKILQMSGHNFTWTWIVLRRKKKFNIK